MRLLRRYGESPPAAKELGKAPGLPRPATPGVSALRRKLLGTAVPLTLVIACCSALDLVWLYRFRSGFPTEWDESGYITIAVRNTHAFQDGGIVSLARTFEHQAVEAPLVPLVTVPLHLLFGVGVTQSLLILPVFFVVLVLATYGIARRLLPAHWALLAALVVAAIPDVTDHTRLYHFAVPAAALWTAAVWGLLQSEGLLSSRFSVLFGVLLGLTSLARTMTLAYLPALAIAAAVQVVAARNERPRRAANLLLAGAAALSVAALWYARNWGAVREYLVGSGFGSDASFYGTRPSVISPAFWTRDLTRVANELYLPLAAALGLAFVVAFVLWIRRPSRPRMTVMISSEALVLTLVVVEGYLAVSSTRNEGTSFELPWLPALVILAVVAVARIPMPSLRIMLATAVASTAVAGVAMKSGFFPELSAFRQTHVPLLGRVVVTDGRDVVQRGAVAASGYFAGDGSQRLPRFQRRWPRFERLVVSRIAANARLHGSEPHGVLASNHQILTNTSLTLTAALARIPIAISWLRPASDTEDAYVEELKKTDAQYMVAAKTPPNVNGRLTLGRAERAAMALGFRRVETFTMPDGRKAFLLWRLG